MATMFVGNIPARRNYGGMLGAGMVKGFEDEQARASQDEEQGFATVVKMYQTATEEDRDLLTQSPGWEKVVKIAERKGIPLVRRPSGRLGFVAPVKTMEEQTAQESAQTGGPAAYGARVEALKSEATGEKPLRSAQATSLNAGVQTDQARTRIMERGAATEERRTGIMEQELGVKAQGQKSELQLKRDELNQADRHHKDRMGMMMKELLLKGAELDAKGGSASLAVTNYPEYNKRMTGYKTDLRQATKMADRQQTLNQAFSDYLAYRGTVDLNDPAQTQLLSSATTDVALLLADELTSEEGAVAPSTGLDTARRQNLLDVINEAKTNGLLPMEISVRIDSLLKTAGYDDTQKGWWKVPQKKSWFGR